MDNNEKLFRIALYVKETMSHAHDDGCSDNADGKWAACSDIKEILEGMETELKKPVEWLFNFVNGGWNSVMATSKGNAIELAEKEYADSDTLNVNEDSFRMSTPTDYNNLLSTFN
jgi:hypothetical protein